MTFLIEEAIIHDTQQTEKAIADLSRSIIVESTSNIIRRANRVLLVTYQEIENSEDSILNIQLQQASETLKQSHFLFKRSSAWIIETLFPFIQIAFPPMIAEAKQLALHPDDKSIHSQWQKKNNEVLVIFRFFLWLIIDSALND